MFMMPSRLEYISWAIEGYAKTKIPLVAYKGTQFIPLSSVADDMGIYVLIPKLAYYFSLSHIQAVYGFVYGLVAIAYCIGCLGFFYVYTSTMSRFVAWLGLTALALLTARMVDVYVAYAVVAMAAIPWFFYCIKNQKRMFTQFNVLLLFTGVAAGVAHYIRAYSSVGLVLCIVVSLCCLGYSFKKKLMLVFFLMLGISLPAFYFTYTYNQYISYKNTVAPELLHAPKNHVFWHAVYLGFGFLANDFGIAWDDAVGQKKALTIDSQAVYPSTRYEIVMRSLVLKLIQQHPKFVLYTLFAKLGVVLLYAFICINIGLVAAIVCPLPMSVQVSFLCALMFNVLFGLIAMPYTNYLLGFITFAVLYGIMSICHALESRSRV